MATGKQSQGLMAKIALLFGETPRPAQPLDPASQPTTEEDAAARKDLAKRQKRDDTVRKREFNHLRPILRKRLDAEHPALSGTALRPSLFRASTGIDERAETLKKIEVIEANVVQSWGANRVAQQASAKTPARPTAPMPPRSPGVTLTEVVTPSVHAALDEDMDLDFTQLPVTPVQSGEDDANEQVPSGINGMSSVLGDSGLSQVESDLRDAAILFSDGDIVATEAQLQSPLESDGLEPDLTDALASALCDVYRYSGQQEKFNATAMEHAARFGRSPPEWFSLPEILSQRSMSNASVGHNSNGSKRAAHWQCPKELQAQDLAPLELDSAEINNEWHLDWAPLLNLHQDTAAPLARLAARWCKQSASMHWSGQHQLLAALQIRTTAQNGHNDPQWWRMHLDVLRILGLQDEFDNLAVDYCTVFEVSPPSWEPARCSLVHATENTKTAGGALHHLAAADSADRVYAQHCNFALVGDLVGEFSPQLEALAGTCALVEHVCVDCRHVGRIDFAAAGSILNLVLQSKAGGSTLQFVQVPYLVAVFFKMLGIDRYAQVLSRTH